MPDRLAVDGPHASTDEIRPRGFLAGQFELSQQFRPAAYGIEGYKQRSVEGKASSVHVVAGHVDCGEVAQEDLRLLRCRIDGFVVGQRDVESKERSAIDG